MAMGIGRISKLLDALLISVRLARLLRNWVMLFSAEDLQHKSLSGSVTGKSGSKRSDRQDAQDDSEPSGPRESENGQERKYDSQHNPHGLLGFYNIFLHPVYLLHGDVIVIRSGIILSMKLGSKNRSRISNQNAKEI